MANPFVHVELNTTDPAKAKAFYAALLDWPMEDVPMGGGFVYTMIKPGQGPGIGLMQHPMPGAPSTWLAYVEVADVSAAVEKVKALGGAILKGATPVPGMGAFAIVSDPTGAVVGLWTSAKR